MSATPYLRTIISLPLTDAELVDIVPKAKDWALMHGACMRSKVNFNEDILQFAPFMLTPTAFPRTEFEKAVQLQPILNELMHRIAHDTEFIRATLSTTIKVDDFTRRLYDIYETVLAEGIEQLPVSVGLLRSDYMLHALADCCIKQVEINTIASSFGGISAQLRQFHSYVLKELGHSDKLINLPENNALSGLCGGLIQAWQLQKKPQAVILFIIEDITYNICDQRFHEFKIRESHPEIRIVRKTLTEIHRYGELGPKKELLIDGKTEATVVYFRAGYEPNHYPTEGEWSARLLIERSQAIKCPSIQYHLVGTKKVQQALANPINLKRFVDDEVIRTRVQDIFTGLYTLDDNLDGEQSVLMALNNPEKYVLKPQREGGGNNVYGVDIPGVLQKLTRDERSALILMDRIMPPLSKGYMIRPGGQIPPPLVDLVSELGIFGVIIGDANKILYNKQVGHMLRTKLSTADEGGVAAGLGSLDSPYLFDE